MLENSFIPVLLGSDANAYGMAQSFHEEYNIRSIAISKTILTASFGTKIIDFTFEPDLENPEKFIKVLIDVAKKNPNKKLLLIPCGDGYVTLVVKFQEKLKEYYEFNCLSAALLDRLSMKESFYDVCEEYGFEYPKTEIVSFESYGETEIALAFPVIIKASNSVEYWKCNFEGKRKVFVAQDNAEFRRILKAIYSSTYKDNLTIQEYIPGDDSNMRVLNCYVGLDKKVKLMALGNPLLEDHTPQGIGNYVAIINTYDKALLEKFRLFLEDIGYSGFANFDMKYDSRDNTYKLFENNIRQGRSSFYVTASGFNLAKWIVDDVILQKEMPLTIAKEEHLWLQAPKGVIYKYVNDEALIQKAKVLIKQKKYTSSLFYKNDMSLKRYIKLKLHSLNHFRKFKKYFGKKGLSE